MSSLLRLCGISSLHTPSYLGQHSSAMVPYEAGVLQGVIVYVIKYQLGLTVNVPWLICLFRPGDRLQPVWLMIISYTFCLLRICGPPGARGPGARAPMTPLLISHWVTLHQYMTTKQRMYNRPLSRSLDRCDRMIQNDSSGGNVYNVTMQIAFLTRKFPITTVWVSSLTLGCNGVFAETPAIVQSE